MIHFEGQVLVQKPVPEVVEKLTDPRFFVPCLPDAENIKATLDSAEWIGRPKFAFFAGSLTMSLSVLERHADGGKFQVTSKGIGATATVVAAMKVVPTDTGSQVQWTADITELTGLLKLVPKGTIQGSAQRVIEKSWEKLQANLQAAN